MKKYNNFLYFSFLALMVLLLETVSFSFAQKIEANEISINCKVYAGKSFNYECTGTPPKACISNPITKQGYTGIGSCITKCQALGGDVTRFQATSQWLWDWYCCNADNSGTCTIETTNDTSITKVLYPINDLLNPPLCDPPEKKPHVGCRENVYQSINSCGIDEGTLDAPCQEKPLDQGTPGGNTSLPGTAPKGKLEVDWPPSPLGTKLTGESLTNLIKYLYEWGIGLGGFLAFIALVIAGFQYLTSAGNAARMKDAMDRIRSAGFGLVLLFSTFLILNTINPQLTDLTMPPPEQLIDNDWKFDLEGQQLSKSTTKTCEGALLYPNINFGGTPPGGAKGLGIGNWTAATNNQKAYEVKSITIYGGCSVTLYDSPNCTQNAFGPYFSSGATRKSGTTEESIPTKFDNIESGGVSSFGCVTISQIK